ncbi:transposase [Haploplasma modicum]|uniref:transposase n=1 Tax=Haploplasma modicum TaxID=2150 RepID=UPI00047C33F7|nr:transposase [Haploplasma modicum]
MLENRYNYLNLNKLSLALAAKAGFRVGYVAFLYTRGRSLNLHPHLHILLVERTVDKLGKHKIFSTSLLVDLKKPLCTVS